MKREFVLLYQVGIANVFERRKAAPQGYMRVRQGTFGQCEDFARGVIACGGIVRVMNHPMAGDALLFPDKWQAGPGELWRESKNPPAIQDDAGHPQGWEYVATDHD